MSDYNFFHDDWLDAEDLITDKPDNIKVNLTPEFFLSLESTDNALRQYRIDAALKCSETLGNKPALCLSGGIDSQAMLQAWKEAGINFDVYTLNFHDNLNRQDVEHARLYCERNDIVLHEIPFDIIRFLTRENYDIGYKYKSPSPHFNVHYRLFELLSDMSYTGACCGGMGLFKLNNAWGNNLQGAPINFINFTKISKFMVQGSFLSYYPHLAWVIGLLTPDIDVNINSHLMEDINNINDIRYAQKVISYQSAGFDIIPQVQKYTGFEYVKDHFANVYKDGWAFEKMFRYKLSDLFSHKNNKRVFELSHDQKEALSRVYSDNFASRFKSSSVI